MRVLVTGAAGMLGNDLVTELRRRGHEVVATDVAELDIANPESVAEIGAGKFGSCDWCINCAAYTAVDKAESEPDLALKINALGPGYLARGCSMAGTRLVHVSTDFVFDGTSTNPYLEDAETHPLGSYGRSKREGEEAVLEAAPNSLIVRTAWLYGAYGNSFPKTMIKAYLAGRQLKVVADQRGSPTYTADLARVLTDILNISPGGGIYHATGPDIMTWRDFAELAIMTYNEVRLGSQEKVEVAPIRTEDWPTPAARPKYSALSFEKTGSLGIEPMRPTKQALEDFCAKLPQSLT